MNKETKAKIIIGASFAVFILLAVLLSMAFSKKNTTADSDQEVNLRAERKNDFSTEDMMKANENRNMNDYRQTSVYQPTTPVSTNQNPVPEYKADNSDIEALQKQLRENRNAQADDGSSATMPTHTLNTQKAKKINATQEVAAVEPIAPINTNPKGRSRNLNSNNQELPDNLISAVIHNDQVITNGAKVKLRLTESIVVDGVTIPRNSFVSGIATFSKTRMNIALKSIIIGSSIIPFNKSVYDKDGMEGIYLPENLRAEDVSETTSDMSTEALNTLSSTGIVGAALTTGKNLFRKKAERQTVTLKANYKLFLK